MERGLDESFYACRNATWKYGHVEEYFWVSGVMLVTVGVLGIVGNILNLVVLCRQQFRKHIFYNLLSALACFDIIFIVSYSTSVGYTSLACNPFNLPIYITYPISNLGLTGSVYMTIAISVERYIGVCRPHTMYKRNAKTYILSVIAISVLYNFPRFVERSFSVKNGSFNGSYAEWARSDLYQNIYHLWASIIMICVLPLAMLLFLNGAILAKISYSSRMVSEFRFEQEKPYGNSTRILLGIVLLFLLCFTLRVVYKCLYYLSPEDKADWYAVSPLSEFGLVLNSSANFILYCLIGTDFRKEFMRVFSLYR